MHNVKLETTAKTFCWINIGFWTTDYDYHAIESVQFLQYNETH